MILPRNADDVIVFTHRIARRPTDDMPARHRRLSQADAGKRFAGAFTAQRAGYPGVFECSSNCVA